MIKLPGKGGRERKGGGGRKRETEAVRQRSAYPIPPCKWEQLTLSFSADRELQP